MASEPQTVCQQDGGPSQRRGFRSHRTPGPGMFLEMDTAKSAARAAGQTIIDLSVGASDLPSPPEALKTLQESCSDPSTHSYCLRSQTMPFLQAACDWFKDRYGLALCPRTQALSLIGSQEGLAHLLMAVADPGDGVLMADVAYPSYFGAVQIAGLRPLFMPLGPDRLPDFGALDPSVAQGARVLLLNYPNNPTGATVDLDFWERALGFARRYDLLLVHDNPYVDLNFDDSQPVPSPLVLPGALQQCVELFSLSKSFHLGGFRLGFALGNPEVLSALESLKAPIDFNQYLGIQRMGVTCLGLPQERLRRDAAIWRSRCEAMVGALAEVGWKVDMPRGGMYIWAKLPPSCCCGDDDLQFAKRLVMETGVAVAPGRCFGPGGHGYVRFALVQPEEVLREAARRIAPLITKAD